MSTTQTPVLDRVERSLTDAARAVEDATVQVADTVATAVNRLASIAGLDLSLDADPVRELVDRGHDVFTQVVDTGTTATRRVVDALTTPAAEPAPAPKPAPRPAPAVKRTPVS